MIKASLARLLMFGGIFLFTTASTGCEFSTELPIRKSSDNDLTTSSTERRSKVQSEDFFWPEGDTGFYVPPKKEEVRVNIKKDYRVIGDGHTDNSQMLQTALDQVSEAGGGTVFVPKGIYVFSGIEMRSNTRLLIKAGTIIRPPTKFSKGQRKKNKPSKLSKITMFQFGRDGERVENISVEGEGGDFIIELGAYEPGIAVFGMGNVENFRISSVHVKDALTKFSAITMGPSWSDSGERGYPSNGYVSNFTQVGASYGYGVVQTQAARNVFFENLSGVGGAVLRMETGAKRVNDEQYGGVSNLVARNISCKDGNAAVMISPHAIHNGAAIVEGVKSDGCGFAVRIAKGYVAKKYDNPDLEAGTFAKGTRVSNIHAKFGQNAQLKTKHYKFMPELLLNEISSKTEDGASFRGPSIGPVINTANFHIIIENITAEGFSDFPTISVKPAPRK